MIELAGGRDNSIFLKDNRVYRPWNAWSENVHHFLQYLQKSGFKHSPRFLGKSKQGQEILSYMPGDSYNYPLQGPIASVQALNSAALVLREYHQHSANYVVSHGVELGSWMLKTLSPVEVICHGDFAPYNVALNQNRVAGVFDFDTAHPGSRLWDVAYAVYCWAPFKSSSSDAIGEGLDNLSAQIQRARVFCDSYALSHSEREQLLEVMCQRIAALIDYILQQAQLEQANFVDNVAMGHHLEYQKDIEYLQRNSRQINEGLIT